MKYADKPQVLKENRVERLYRGGAYLDQWQGLDRYGDGFFSEEFLVSTVPYIGPGKPPNQGISLSDCEGQEVSLSQMISTEEMDFLGKSYGGHTGGHLGVLARVGDTTQRLIIQCHPTDAFAQKYLNCQFGKTEAWYILNQRGGGGYCYAGLKKGCHKQGFVDAFRTGDSQAMLDMMHKIAIKKGDMILIPSGMLHAMGENSTFLEFHQPCDYTLRFECNYFGRQIVPQELHCGLGEDRLLEAVDFSTFTEEEIMCIVKKSPSRQRKMQGGNTECLLSHADNSCFRIDRMQVDSYMTFCQKADSHCIMIAAKGDVQFYNIRTGQLMNTLPQGRGAVIPSMAGTFQMKGNGGEVLIGYPYETGKGVSYGLFI